MVTLEDVKNVLNLDDDKGKKDKAVYGEVKAINADKTYQVSLNGSGTTVKCARLSGAKVGDTVLVEVLSNGYAVVTGTVGGDTDASDAQASATAAQTAAGEAQTAAATALTKAQEAEDSAEQAATAAATADSKATAAGTAAAAAQTSADQAASAAATADSKATAASSAASRAESSASAASTAASQAVTDAAAAQTAANNAGQAASRAQAAADAAQGEIDEQQEYFWHDALGAHVLSDTDDVTGNRYRTDLKGAGQEIFELDGQTETSVAKFGADGARLGETGGAHSVIDEDGQRFYASDGTTQLANIGYGETQGSSSGTRHPYYTLGVRSRTQEEYIGRYSLSEGYMTDAQQEYAHSEGYYSNANSVGAHAEGCHCSAEGQYSHAQNYYTQTQSNYQTAIGKYNNNHYFDAFEIGNGTSDSARSNAFTVDWSGNTKAAGDITDGSGNKLSDRASTTKYGMTQLVNSYSSTATDKAATPNAVKQAYDLANRHKDYITEQGTSGEWTYRKWNSGKIEAWCEHAFGRQTGTVWTSFLRFKDLTLAIPSEIFTSAPSVHATSSQSQWQAWYANASSATSVSIRCVTPVSAANLCTVSFYCVQS